MWFGGPLCQRLGIGSRPAYLAWCRDGGHPDKGGDLALFQELQSEIRSSRGETEKEHLSRATVHRPRHRVQVTVTVLEDEPGARCARRGLEGTTQGRCWRPCFGRSRHCWFHAPEHEHERLPLAGGNPLAFERTTCLHVLAQRTPALCAYLGGPSPCGRRRWRNGVYCRRHTQREPTQARPAPRRSRQSMRF